jgi:hypothetical protein
MMTISSDCAPFTKACWWAIWRLPPYRVSGIAAQDSFNPGSAGGSLIHGPEYLARATTYAPDGSVTHGASKIEQYISGAYRPY